MVATPAFQRSDLAAQLGGRRSTSLFTDVGGSVGDAVGAVGDAVGSVGDAFGAGLGQVGEWMSGLPDWMSEIYGGDPPTLPPGHVPQPGTYHGSQYTYGAGVGADGPVPAGGFVPVPTGPGSPAPAGAVAELSQSLMSQAATLGRQPSEIQRFERLALAPIQAAERAARAAGSEPLDFTNWEERTRLLNESEKNILAQAAANMDLSEITADELDLRLRQIGLQESEANNLMARVGLQREAFGIERRRIDLQEAGVQEAIDYLKETLDDVDLDEESMRRNLETIADQISMTGLQAEEIGFQREDVGDLADITGTLLAAREALLGEETATAEERIDIERQRLGLEEESTTIEADRALKAALRDAYARGASFTTGVREDVADLGRVRELALDEIGLRRTGLDVAGRELAAQTDYQEAEIAAARRRADIDLDQNLRALDLDESEIGFLADRLGRSAADVTDAITRLDTDRLGIQLQIADQTRALEGLGLADEDIALQLRELGYDEDDINLTLAAYGLQREGIGLEERAAAVQDTMRELEINRALLANDLQEIGLSEDQALSEARIQQHATLVSALDDIAERELLAYTGDEGLLSLYGGLGAAQQMTQAVQQWAPVLAGLTRGEYEQLQGLSGQIPALGTPLPPPDVFSPEMMWVPPPQQVIVGFPEDVFSPEMFTEPSEPAAEPVVPEVVDPGLGGGDLSDIIAEVMAGSADAGALAPTPPAPTPPLPVDFDPEAVLAFDYAGFLSGFGEAAPGPRFGPPR